METLERREPFAGQKRLTEEMQDVHEVGVDPIIQFRVKELAAKVITAWAMAAANVRSKLERAASKPTALISENVPNMSPR